MKRLVLLVAVFAISVGSTAIGEELSIHCLSVGNGDCTLIVSPSGKTMMVDAGRTGQEHRIHLCDYLDSLGIHRLDYLVITHYHNDHLGGVDTLVQHGVTIDTVYDRGWRYCGTDFDGMYVPTVNSIRHTLADGQVLDMGAGVSATVLTVNGNGQLIDTPFVDRDCPSGEDYDENDFSVGLLIDYGEFQFFAAGDLSGVTDGGYTDIETSVAAEVADIDVYRVNHHGSRFSTNETFLAALSPEVSILSVGGNAYHHPDTAVLRRLDEVSVVYQTAGSDGVEIDGDIVIRTDGSTSYSVNDDTYILQVSPYYHAFQNFDDDVDRVKTYSNFFGGDAVVMPEDSANPMISCTYDTIETRFNVGRSMKIDYGPLSGWSMYVESFDRQWADWTTSFNLDNLFPDYEDPQFTDRHIDSIVFYCKLTAADPLTLEIQLHDSSDTRSSVDLDIMPTATFQRVSVALDQFSGGFESSAAKFIGLQFDSGLNNDGEQGTLIVDDFALVENGYTKPEFTSDFELLNYINQVSFRHLWMAVDPVHELALDRHTWKDLISVDAVGFQLASYVVAHQRGWISPTLIEARVTNILSHLLYTCKHAADASVVAAGSLEYATVNGIWAHFLDYENLTRKDANTEYSLFTNGLLLAGVLVCQEYFAENDSIVAMADSLYRMADWNFLYVPDSNVMRYAWAPEYGYSPNWTDWFTEELDLAFLLAISSPDPSHRIGANPYWSALYRKPICTDYSNLEYIYSAPGSGFTYYFLQTFAKFGHEDDLYGSRNRNTRNALLTDLAFCNDRYGACSWYDPRIFGTTACEGPDSAGEGVSNYHAYGFSCRYDSTIDKPNGTIAVYGSGAAMPFVPDEATACLRYYYDELDETFADEYNYNFWSPIFGFPDGFNLDPDNCGDPAVDNLGFRGPWVCVPRFGIDVGPMLLNIDSYLSESSGDPSIRSWFSQNVNISPNLKELVPLIDAVEDRPDNLPGGYCLYQCYPNPFNSIVTIRFDLPRKERVFVEVLNIIGQRVAVIADGEFRSGGNRIYWDGTGEFGRNVASGVYFCKLKSGDFVDAVKMVLVK